MTLYDIETFLTVVETHNITKTAESLCVTQPTVSRRLKGLEDEVGVKLLRRSRGMKHIELTEQGEAFVLVAERWLSIWREMTLIKNEKESSFLTISSVDTVNSAVLVHLYQELLRKPAARLKLHIQTHHSNTIYRLVEQCQVDIGFVVFKLDYKNVNVNPIARERMYIVQADREAALRKPVLHTDELADRTEIHLRGDINFQNWHNHWLDRENIAPIHVDTYALLARLLLMENTWAIAPASVVEQLQREQPVFVSRIANETPPPDRVIYYITHKYMNETVRRVAAQFKTLLDNYISLRDWS